MSKAKSSKSPKRSQRSKILQDDEIDEIMENITLKRPRNAYTQFCMDEVEKFKSKNKKEKINLKEFSGECAAKWKKLGDKEKTKYNERFEQEKIKYRQDIETVRHHLFMDYNDVVHRPPTAYRLFLNERLREGFEKNADPKDVKKKAAEKWRKMSLEEKSEYIEKKKENDTWFEKAKKTRKVNPLTMFVQKAIQTAKEKNANIPKLADLAETWKSLKQSDKDKYVRYAEEINEEREKLYHIYEIIHGVKPKRPAGAFRIFLQEKAKNKELHDIKEGKELWDKLSDDEKDAYLKKSHTLRLAYKYKKMIYNKKIKRVMPKKPPTAYGFFLKEKKGVKVPKGEKAVVHWLPYFNDLSRDKKKKYEEQAKLARLRYEKKMEDFKKYTFDMPKRPLNAFTLFVRDRVPDLKKKNKDANVQKLIRLAAKEWQSQEGVSQKAYERKAEQDKKRFKRQLKEFEAKGYYRTVYRAERTKDEEDESEEEEEEKRTKKKRRSTSSRKSSKRTRSKSKARSKSKSKTQDVKRKTKSGKRSASQKRK